MVEIIVGVWLTCLGLSAVVVGFNYYVTSKQLRSAKLQQLNRNLAKAGLYWSNSNADFAGLTEGAIEEDARKTLRHCLWIGLLGLASIPGFLLLTAVVISIRFFVRPRREVAAFGSALAQEDLKTSEEVALQIAEIRSLH